MEKGDDWVVLLTPGQQDHLILVIACSFNLFWYYEASNKVKA